MSETEKKKPVSRSKEAFKLRMREQARNSKDSPFPWKTVGIGAAAAACNRGCDLHRRIYLAGWPV